ncbi:hypothetical protein PPL_07541 [Heterostelium album PN500]|uniref:GGDEF domain-containing protein n=1 Tax=Heterostelium pallidum (strain ATCC 26659 / Pp 5 / PN500) TaxID=670386 RepID=D3BG90_HETP5|nr:hypothetical protein PPL_07541 [Heterostelium album PN500]EFA79490.1 hypothetical protein PPL_07541 [Heterostelium album PN500]|eukprot:XP_020431611.1 hypothetical protein PPL_07541 [Heterostelium album PN500]
MELIKELFLVQQPANNINFKSFDQHYTTMNNYNQLYKSYDQFDVNNSQNEWIVPTTISTPGYIKIEYTSSLPIYLTIIFSIVICCIYKYLKADRQIIQYANTFKEILDHTPTLILVEICFSGRRLVKTSNPVLSRQSQDQILSYDHQQQSINQSSIESFCEHYGLDAFNLERVLSTSMTRDSIVKGNNSQKYRFTGTYDSNTQTFKGVIFDISQEESELKRLKYILAHDPLTGLQNRYRLNQKIQKFCSKSTTDLCAVFFIDVNKFKQINDTYGHDSGDLVLKHLSERLQESQGNDTLPIRLSGDEFLVVKRGISSIEDANQYIVNYLNGVAAAPVQVATGVSIYLSLSYGGVVFQKSETAPQSVDQIIKSADEKILKTSIMNIFGELFTSVEASEHHAKVGWTAVAALLFSIIFLVMAISEVLFYIFSWKFPNKIDD